VSAVALLAGLRQGAGRCARAGSVGGAAIALSVVLLGALAEKRSALAGAANRALLGSAFGLVIPLVVFATVAAIIGPGRLDYAASPIARFGHSRRQVAAGLALAAMAIGGVAAAVLGATSAVAAHDPTAPPVLFDALAAAWIGAVTGCAYAAFFVFGSTMGRRGGGRYLALALDFSMGATGTAAAVLCPRAHATNLLGGEPLLHVGQSASLLMLIALSAVFWAAAVLRCPP
jgi:hypothetical protein